VQSVAQFAEIALRQFASSGMRQWEEQTEYRRLDGTRTLLLRGTRLGSHGENGYVIVFDDITHLIQAQRDAAWGEVARASRTKSRTRSRRSSFPPSACS
jgi:nitrogen fixation/metabolism regulation signal transduction histidine kinase